ncbi:hypothetical protein HispidOSU_004231, partial [Sigmodon hispidus]
MEWETLEWEIPRSIVEIGSDPKTAQGQPEQEQDARYQKEMHSLLLMTGEAVLPFCPMAWRLQ